MPQYPAAQHLMQANEVLGFHNINVHGFPTVAPYRHAANHFLHSVALAAVPFSLIWLGTTRVEFSALVATKIALRRRPPRLASGPRAIGAACRATSTMKAPFGLDDHGSHLPGITAGRW
jgi:hypothetical protein